MTKQMKADVVVIGSGPGGYTAAFRAADLGKQVAALKRVNDVPVCIGFGISSPEQAALAAIHGDGVIVGSHLVRLIEKHGKDKNIAQIVAARAGVLAAAVHKEHH